MKSSSISAIALAIGLAFSTGAMAQQMSRSEYTLHKDAIQADLKTAKSGCDALSANAKDICIAKAEGSEKVAAAELEARYQPTDKTRYDVGVAKAEAAYAIAKEQCDDKAGNAKDVCLKEAKAAHTAAKADAKMKAKELSTDARQDAVEEKREANYEVAKEKCDAFAGSAKDSCLAEAKARFGKS